MVGKARSEKSLFQVAQEVSGHCGLLRRAVGSGVPCCSPRARGAQWWWWGGKREPRRLTYFSRRGGAGHPLPASRRPACCCPSAGAGKRAGASCCVRLPGWLGWHAAPGAGASLRLEQLLPPHHYHHRSSPPSEGGGNSCKGGTSPAEKVRPPLAAQAGAAKAP